MTSQILDPDTLTGAQRRACERAQFEPLSAEAQEWYLEMQKRIDNLYDNTSFARDYMGEDQGYDYAINQPAFNLTHRELGTIIDWNMDRVDKQGRGTNRAPRLLDAYLGMICRYVNQVRGNARESERLVRLSDRARLAATAAAAARTTVIAAETTVVGKRKREEDEKAAEIEFEDLPTNITQNSPSCAFMEFEVFHSLREGCIQDLDPFDPQRGTMVWAPFEGYYRTEYFNTMSRWVPAGPAPAAIPAWPGPSRPWWAMARTARWTTIRSA